MYPLLLCSIVALTVFLERIRSLRKRSVIPPGFTDTITREILREDVEAASAFCEAHISSPMARISRAGLSQIEESPELIRFIVAEVGSQEAMGLEKYQRILATTAYLAPLLGLLGTVSGMIEAFDTISQHTVGDPALLAGGISEALITTAAGLVVAIPVVIMHKIVQSRAAGLSLKLERESVTLTEHLIKLSQKASVQGRAA